MAGENCRRRSAWDSEAGKYARPDEGMRKVEEMENQIEKV